MWLRSGGGESATVGGHPMTPPRPGNDGTRHEGGFRANAYDSVSWSHVPISATD